MARILLQCQLGIEPVAAIPCILFNDLHEFLACMTGASCQRGQTVHRKDCRRCLVSMAPEETMSLVLDALVLGMSLHIAQTKHDKVLLATNEITTSPLPKALAKRLDSHARTLTLLFKSRVYPPCSSVVQLAVLQPRSVGSCCDLGDLSRLEVLSDYCALDARRWCTWHRHCQ